MNDCPACKEVHYSEKKESKLQKALDAANRLIAKLKTEIAGLKQELSEYKSIRSKLRTSDLERENAELRGKVQLYEDVIQRNNLGISSVHAEKKQQCVTMPADAVLS